MTVRTTARTAMVAGLAAAAVSAGAGPAAAARDAAVGGPVTKANALFVDEDEDVVVDATVAEIAGGATTATVDLYAPGLACTVHGQPEAADLVRLESARIEGTFDYTCEEQDGGGAGAVPGTLSGTVVVDVTWTGVGAPEAQPLYDGAVGHYIVRDAEVSGSVSLTGDLSAHPELNSAHLSRDATVVPPGRLR